MSTPLRDQLLGLGFKPVVAKPKPQPNQKAKKPEASRSPAGSVPAGRAKNKTGAPEKPAGRVHKNYPNKNKHKDHKDQPKAKTRTAEEIDLAKAYAIRAEKEEQERLETQRQQQAHAQQRKQAQAALAAFIQDKTLNDPQADIARHFPYGGKIKRIYVTADQLKALNAGELGVLQHKGRYVLVSAQTLLEAEKLFAPAVALKVDPNVPAEDDPYTDPKYQVPDDLVW